MQMCSGQEWPFRSAATKRCNRAPQCSFEYGSSGAVSQTQRMPLLCQKLLCQRWLYTFLRPKF